MGNIIMAGVFPLPPSVNTLYATIWIKGIPRRVLSEEGKAYKDTVYDMLMAAPNGHEIYTDEIAIKAIAQNYKKSQRNRKIVRTKFHLEMLCVFENDKRDLSNTIKILEDTILMKWLGCNDNQVISLYPKKVVDSSVSPHVETVLRECVPAWKSGDLLAEAMKEVDFYKAHTGSFYSEPTLIGEHNAITEVDRRIWKYPVR